MPDRLSRETERFFWSPQLMNRESATMSSEERELIQKHMGHFIDNKYLMEPEEWDAIAQAARAFVREEIENTPIGELTLIQQVEFKAGKQEPCPTCGGSGTVWADKYSGPNAEPWPGLLFGGELQPCPDCNGKENE